MLAVSLLARPAINVNLPAPERFEAANIPLRDLIRLAFDVQDARVQGGPDWIRSERFALAVHRETKWLLDLHAD